MNIRLLLVGDGGYRRFFTDRAHDLGLNERVQFLGQLPSVDVRACLDQADLFVLPSRAEGLPRAMIEAMARGLPAIGSTVGGIPELLPAEELVAPHDVIGLAWKLREVLCAPARLAQMAARNFKTAHEYQDTVLHKRRREFYTYVKAQTDTWLTAR